MRLTTKSRYAVDALTELQLLQINGPVALSEISMNQDIELNYLEQLFRKLRIAGIVKSLRGRNGGYIYAKDPSHISIKDVMDAVEEIIDSTKCNGKASCKKGNKCYTHDLWDDLNVVIYKYLSGVSLKEIFENSQKSDIPHVSIN